MRVLGLCVLVGVTGKGNTKRNTNGYTFVVREKSIVTFDPYGARGCTETFLFPNTKPDAVMAVVRGTDLVPCSLPGPDAVKDIPSGVTAETKCTGREGKKKVTVVCSVNGVPVSLREGRASGIDETFSKLIGCQEPHQEAALAECASSVANMATLIAAGIEFKFQPVHVRALAESPAVVAESAPEVAEPPVEQVTVAKAAEAPVAETVLADSKTPVPDSAVVTEEAEVERKLAVITGRNQLGFHFEVLNGGIITFLPRVGLECRETFIFDGYSSTQKFNAALWSTFEPCRQSVPPMKRANIDPSWDIVKAHVDCTDDTYISITCAVVFGTDAPVEMARVAKLQANQDLRYLSSRVGCGAPGDNELVECASLAKHYLQMKEKIPID